MLSLCCCTEVSVDQLNCAVTEEIHDQQDELVGEWVAEVVAEIVGKIVGDIG